MEDNKELKHIDLLKIYKAVVKHRKDYLIALPVAFILSSLFIICIPRHYTCMVKLAPELSSTSMSSLGSLAASFGVDIASKMGNDDAISPELYPDLMKSADFRVSLFPIHVKTHDGKVSTNYYTYLSSYQKYAWWDSVLRWMSSKFAKKAEPFNGKDPVNPFLLTRPQYGIALLIGRKISCTVDKKTDVISITVKDQDPLVCATIADSIRVRLQSFITDYRTNKARNDLEYTKQLYVEAKKQYEKARQRYGTFSDANQELYLESYKARQEDLENEMQLQYNNYSMVSTQLQAAKAKVQEKTPAFTTLQSASVPVKPAGPKRMIFVAVVLFLTAIAVSIRAFIKEN